MTLDPIRKQTATYKAGKTIIIPLRLLISAITHAVITRYEKIPNKIKLMNFLSFGLNCDV